MFKLFIFQFFNKYLKDMIKMEKYNKYITNI